MAVSRAEFAELCGVTEMAISKAVRRGEVIEGDGGSIKLTDPVNRAYRQADHTVAKRPKSGTGGGEGRGKRSEDIAQLHRQMLVEKIRNLNAKTAKDDVDRARKLDMYTERRMVETCFAAFGAEWKPQILDMPKRIVPVLYEMCRAGRPLQEAILYAEKEIAEATKALKEKARAVGLGDLTT
jgi:hypothetical protein